MKAVNKYIKLTIFAICISSAILLSYFFSYENSKIINTNTILDILVTLFSVLLAIVALMITILDKYKNNAHNQNIWATQSTAILKSLSENTIFLLLIIFIVVLTSMVEDLLTLIPIFNIMNVILLSSIMLALFITLDTTFSVHLLVIHLKDALVEEKNPLTLNQTEKYLVEAYRFLTPKNQEELASYIKTLSLKQQLDKETHK